MTLAKSLTLRSLIAERSSSCCLFGISIDTRKADAEIEGQNAAERLRLETQRLREQNQAVRKNANTVDTCAVASVTGASDHAEPPHPVFGDWCYCQPGDSQRLLDRQLSYRDAALKEDPSFSGMPPEFEQWCKTSWLPSNLGRDYYRKQAETHIQA